MLNPKGWCRIFIGSVVVVGLLIVSGKSFSEETTHTFKSGDIISADMLNEAFNSVELSLSDTIIGVWSTQCWDVTSTNANSPGIGMLTVISLTDISYTGVSCLGRTNADGSASHTISEFITIGESVLITTHNSGLKTNPILELTTNRIVVITQNDGIEILTRQNTVPDKPTRLSVSSSGLKVMLSWTDNSEDETGFKILRRDQLEKKYNEIGTTDGTSYTDTVPSAGKYWYRVKATNDNGDSVGSNVAKVTITE